MASAPSSSFGRRRGGRRRSTATTKTGKQRKTVVDDATAAGEAYGISRGRRKMIECLFCWGKQHGMMRKTKHRGMAAVAGDFLNQYYRLQSDPNSKIARRIARSPCKEMKRTKKAGKSDP